MNVIESLPDGKTRLVLQNVDWHQVLPRLGIDSELIANPRKLGPCPICGGNTRFRMVNDDGKGHWFCNGCGVGDAPKLVALLHGCDNKTAMLKIKEVILDGATSGYMPVRKSSLKEDTSRENARRFLNETYKESEPISQNSASWRYLSRRVPGLRLDWISPNLRMHGNLRHQIDAVKQGDQLLSPKKVSYWPALLGIVVDIHGVFVTLHRTYLTSDGSKAPFPPDQVKKQMTGVRKLAGEHIPVNVPYPAKPGVKRKLIVCEGIETALALVAMTGNKYQVWAMLNASNLGMLTVGKDDFDLVVIGGDHDKADSRGRRAGHVFGQKAVEKCLKDGMRAVLRMPEIEGQDWADVWVDQVCRYVAAA